MDSSLTLQAEHTESFALFPSCIWQTRLTPEATKAINAPMLARLDALRAGHPALPPGQTYQTEQNLHQDPAFAGFVNLLHGTLAGVLDFLKIEQQPMLITGCWANIGAPGADHTPHTHPNNFLSGVYYLRAPGRANRITFDDPRPQTYVLSPMVSQVSVDNGSFVNVTVQEGFLLIFPAWLQHRVPRNDSAEERVSVSFNAMFPRYAETLAQSTSLPAC